MSYGSIELERNSFVRQFDVISAVIVLLVSFEISIVKITPG